jgi:phage terminase large subunit
VLKVSRDDVDRDEITEFPIETRFIKLPIENYLKLLGAWDTMNRPQIALINAINNPKYRFVCAALARRLGKTYIANIIAQLVSLVPGCNVLIISPNYNLSSISFELQRKFIRHFDLEVERDNLKDKVVELSNGSTIRMGSLSTVDSTVGRSYQIILFDEAALGDDGESAFNVQLRPTLDRPNSKAIFISTPRGQQNWFSRFYQRGFSNDYPEWCSIQADYTENSRMAESDVQEARRSMSKAEFEQEYLASFNVFEGQIYSFNREVGVLEYEHQDGCEYIAGCDPGYRDATAFVVISYNPVSDQFHIVDEYLKSEATTDKHATAFREYLDKWQVEVVFIDSAAAQFAGDLAYTYNISTTRAKKDILPGIAYVQTLVETGRLKVAPHCTNVLDVMDQYRWDSRETLAREKPVHDKFSHMADAIRYALYTYTL